MKSFAEIRFPIIVCIVAACAVIGCSPYKKTQQSILTVHTDIDSIPQYRKLLFHHRISPAIWNAIKLATHATASWNKTIPAVSFVLPTSLRIVAIVAVHGT